MMMKREIPSRPAVRRLRMYPSIAPAMPSASSTSMGAMIPLIVASVIVVRALYSFLSRPEG